VRWSCFLHGFLINVGPISHTQIRCPASSADALLVPDELYIAPDLKIGGVVGDDATRRRLEELTKTKTEKILRLSTNDPNQAQLLWADIKAIDGELQRDFASVKFWTSVTQPLTGHDPAMAC
jgi:hypothetical protein